MSTPRRHGYDPQRPLSPAMEDYLKAILALDHEGHRASTQSLAETLEVAPASVTGMLKRLAEADLVAYTPYQGVALTAAGRRVAAEIVRHHRLLELYLTQALGFAWDEVHAEAERLEHFISEEFEDRIDAALGFPSHDPHGDPIPTVEGHMPASLDVPLEDQFPGQRLEVVRVRDEDPSTLRDLADAGIFPGVTLELVGPGSIRVGGRMCSLPRERVSSIRVRPAEAGSPPVLVADHLEPGQLGRIVALRARGARLGRLRELGVETGHLLRGRRASEPGKAALFDLQGQPLTLTREDARSILVALLETEGDEA